MNGGNPPQIIVSLHDGGGIEVYMANYRPLSLHVRVIDDEIAASAVANAVRGCVLEWIADQRKRKRVRRVYNEEGSSGAVAGDDL